METGLATSSEAGRITAIIVGSVSLACCVLLSTFVVYRSRDIVKCKRFPVLFFGITNIGYASLACL
jgi:hypothetical protein